MSSHLTSSHRRSADNNSRERHSRTRESNGGNLNDYNTAGGGSQSRSRGQNRDENQIKEAIIDLYLKVKIRSKDEVS